MRLGQRWPANRPAPGELSAELISCILEIELGLDQNNRDISNWYWTLTYLENRPVIQLDDGTTIRVSADGLINVSQED